LLNGRTGQLYDDAALAEASARVGERRVVV
jgi:hypothetical protein